MKNPEDMTRDELIGAVRAYRGMILGSAPSKPAAKPCERDASGWCAAHSSFDKPAAKPCGCGPEWHYHHIPCRPALPSELSEEEKEALEVPRSCRRCGNEDLCGPCRTRAILVRAVRRLAARPSEAKPIRDYEMEQSLAAERDILRDARDEYKAKAQQGVALAEEMSAHVDKLQAYIKTMRVPADKLKESPELAEFVAAKKEHSRKFLALAALLENPARPSEAEAFRCFHCDEVFTDRQAASDHFAVDGIPPMCVDPITKDEKARMVVVRRLEAEIAKLRKENEELDHKAGCLGAMQSELARYFGNCGGGPVKTASQAWLVHEAMIGRAEAAESDLAASVSLRKESERMLAEVMKERDYWKKRADGREAFYNCKAQLEKLDAAEKRVSDLEADRAVLDRISISICGKPYSECRMDLPVYVQNEITGRRIAEDELEEIRAAHAAVMDENCQFPDEKHCTCVPALRKRLSDLEAQGEAYLRAIVNAVEDLEAGGLSGVDSALGRLQSAIVTPPPSKTESKAHLKNCPMREYLGSEPAHYCYDEDNGNYIECVDGCPVKPASGGSR